MPLSPPLSPLGLATRQRELDRASTARFPALGTHKRKRMLPSAHAFLRGSAPLFYEILASRPDLAAGPPGEGWIVGDMHLENVGAYRTDADRIAFDINDFDDAAIGPLRLDVLRLATSVILASAARGADGTQTSDLLSAMLDGYLTGVGGGPASALPSVLGRMVDRAEKRSRRELIDHEAPEKHGKRSFPRGESYFDLPEPLRLVVPDRLRDYIGALGARVPSNLAKSATIADAAQRVAGTGSLGVLRIAVLVRDAGGEDRIIELKESRAPSPLALVPRDPAMGADDATRVVRAAHALVASPPRQLAAVTGGDVSFAGRKLFPQEDKLKIDGNIPLDELRDAVRFIGGTLGRAHVRGVIRRPELPWSRAELEVVADHAIALAGIIGGAYLAYARLDA